MQLELRDVVSRRVGQLGKKNYGWGVVAIVQRETAAEFGLLPDSINASGRFKTQTLARHTACFLVRDMTVLSWPEIGLAFGGRDHTTMMAGYRKVEKLLRADEAFRLRVAVIKSRIVRTLPLELEVIPEVADELDRRYGSGGS
jgi:chromosomal replication initiation ATPase DnaA